MNSNSAGRQEPMSEAENSLDTLQSRPGVPLAKTKRVSATSSATSDDLVSVLPDEIAARYRHYFTLPTEKK